MMQLLLNSQSFASLIRQQVPTLLTEWRDQVRQLQVARDLDNPTLNDHIPHLLEELAREFDRSDAARPMVDVVPGTSSLHGLDRLNLGFDIEEVVAEYSALREVLHALVKRAGMHSHDDIYCIINRVLDRTIGLAVKAFAAQKATEIQKQRQEYLSFVAHDLRTPLAAIAMAAYLLKENLESAPETDVPILFEALHSNVARLNAMIVKVVQEENNIQAFFGEGPERVRTPLEPIVQACMNELGPLALSKGTALINEVPPALEVFGNVALLAQVFQNLLSNAISYCPKGEVKVGAAPTLDGTECWVSDNGAGIPPERLDSVFAKWGTDRSGHRGGMGLGLTIVRQCVEAHGGHIKVESEPGQGAKFTFSLQGEEAQAAARSPEAK